MLDWIPAFAGMTGIGSEAIENLKFGVLRNVGVRVPLIPTYADLSRRLAFDHATKIRSQNKASDKYPQCNRYCDIRRSPLRYSSGKQNFTQLAS
jgi:hypothetical protein